MSDSFQQAYQRIQESYNEFSALLDTYPSEKQDMAGALGDWSAKQVVAHLSGWLMQAISRYQEIQAGNIENSYVDDADGFNAQSVSVRDAQTWMEIVYEFRKLLADLFLEVDKLNEEQRTGDMRFSDWLIGLDKEFRNHAVDLRRFRDGIKQQIPILEYDEDKTAVIEPHVLLKRHEKMPERVVFCFFREVIKTVRTTQALTVIHQLGSEIGDNPIYRIMVEGEPVAIVHPGVGAPLAAGFLEESIALGGRKFIACGGAGVLSSDISVGTVVIPESAVRDEGTSYHYLPPSREVSGNPRAVNAIKSTLVEHRIPYRVGKTWTTDAIYRETRNKVETRKAEGCLTVEMETAAFFAVAKYRDVIFGQLLYGGDDLGGVEWDHRGWQGQLGTRDKLFWLAVEAVLKL